MSDESPQRIALVGATGFLGREIKDRLAAADLPGDLVELLDLDDEVGLLTDYGDEARVVLEAAEETLRGFGLVCFAGDPEVTRRFAPAVLESGAIVVDCTGALEGEVWGGGLVRPGSTVIVPHGGTALLGGLARALDLADASATLLLPVSELHDRGPESLSRQTASMLSFDDEEGAEEEIFGRRQAFDVWASPEDLPARRIAAELGALGLPSPRLMTLRAPIFHALAASIWLPGTDAAAARDRLAVAGVPVAEETIGGIVDSPGRIAGRPGISVAIVREDAGGVWLWALLDNFQSIADGVIEIVEAYRSPATETVN